MKMKYVINIVNRIMTKNNTTNYVRNLSLSSASLGMLNCSCVLFSIELLLLIFSMLSVEFKSIVLFIRKVGFS